MMPSGLIFHQEDNRRLRQVIYWPRWVLTPALVAQRSSHMQWQSLSRFGFSALLLYLLWA